MEIQPRQPNGSFEGRAKASRAEVAPSLSAPSEHLNYLNIIENKSSRSGKDEAVAASNGDRARNLPMPVSNKDGHKTGYIKIVDDNPPTARDIDRIEKVWVAKSKQIINSTRGDPYMQEKSVSRLRAEYLNKRYDKKIKIAEE